MLEKTMKKVLNKKIEDWIGSIADEAVQEAIRRDLIVSGGCFTSFIQSETPNDFDCYFRTKETVVAVANYYVDLWNERHPGQENAIGFQTKVFVLDGESPSQELLEYYNIKSLQESASRMISNTPPERVKIIFPSDGVVGDPEAADSGELGTPVSSVTEVDEASAEDMLKAEKEKYFPVFMSTNAITLSNGIQLIVRFYGEPDQIHDTYDFQHTKAYYRYSTKDLNIPKEVYEAVINKTLVYTGSRYPVSSVFRLRKFIERGWHINAGQLLKIAMQISDLDLTDIDVLEDQLVGVDSLYFMMLIREFQRRQQKDPNFTLTTSYVLSVVDKIF